VQEAKARLAAAAPDTLRKSRRDTWTDFMETSSYIYIVACPWRPVHKGQTRNIKNQDRDTAIVSEKSVPAPVAWCSQNHDHCLVFSLNVGLIWHNATGSGTFATNLQ